jgi:hypothetical protein
MQFGSSSIHIDIQQLILPKDCCFRYPSQSAHVDS